MAPSRWLGWFALTPLLACTDPGDGEDEIFGDTDSTGDEATTDDDASEGTDDADVGTSESSDDATSTDADTDATTDDATTDDATTDDATTDTSETGDGDGDACPSFGSGGSVGQSAIASDEYPNTPGVLYVPQSYDPGQPVPMMLALHGSGDTAGNFVNLWANLSETYGFIVLVPESLSGGASWNPGPDAMVISPLLDKVQAEYNVDTCRVYLTGYSAGAHYGYMLGLANSAYFAALGIQAGTLSYAEQGGIWPDMVERQIPVAIFHGMNDPYVPIGEATYARDQLEAAGHIVHYNTHSGGHEIAADDPLEMWMQISNYSTWD